jgi:hypothetical protein
LSPGPPEYEAGVLTTHPQSSVWMLKERETTGKVWTDEFIIHEYHLKEKKRTHHFKLAE